MLELLQVWFVCSAVGCCYSILIQPGELLQHFARFMVQNVASEVLKKLILCPYCLSGQMAFWLSFYFAIQGNFLVFVSVPLTILTVYHYIKSYDND